MRPRHSLPARTWVPSAPGSDRYEKLYRMLLDSIPSSVLFIDPQLRVVSANLNFMTKARVVEPQVVGHDLAEVLPAVLYEQMNLGVRVAEVFRRGEATEGGWVSYRTPGLPSRTYYFSLTPLCEADRVEYVMLFMEDVTEKVRLGEEVRRAERHLASVVESASDLVVSTDVAGRVLTWNAAAVKATGYEEGEVRHRTLCDFCTAASKTALGTALEQVPRVGRTGPVEADLLDRQGREVPIAWVCSPMRDAEGRVTGVVVVGRDLTERRAFEAQLLRSEKLAALGVMAGGIAHEIRNPLAVVSAAAQMLLEPNIPAPFQRECAERINRGVQRAAGVIENLLRFARPSEQGNLQPLDLVKVVEESVSLVGHMLKLEHIQLRKHLPQGAVQVLGHPGLLQQLVTNLLLNAANAIPPSGGTVTVALEREKNRVNLSVEDDGKGIPETELPCVFDPFFTTMPVGKGMGLGLSISYAIVQHHGGRIDIQSQVGQGTVVSVTLPAGPRRSGNA